MNPWLTAGGSLVSGGSTNYHTLLDDRMTTLDLAISFYWSQGEPLPLDLAVELLNQGMDVEALEAEHMA